tara:strand:- start:205 stop:831 length:627 start_codon:yes stop_codon:yes gene_type:complete
LTSIKDLKSDHKNARKRTDRSATLIKESLEKFGAARSIVIDEDNRILAGNGTIEGAKAAGIKNLRVIETDGKEIIAVKRIGLTEEDKVGLALADNRTSDLSEWDREMLLKLSEENDLSPWFEEEDLDALLGEGVEEADLPDLDNGEKEPFQQMSFVLHDEQVALVNEAIAKSKDFGEFTNSLNQNSNGNALARIAELFIGWSDAHGVS